MSKNVVPVRGAAVYYAAVDRNDGSFVVAMRSTDSEGVDVIQVCKTAQRAVEAADRWQKRENKAVEKARRS